MLRISLAPVRRRAILLGIKNPWALHRAAGITYNTAKRYWGDDRTMTRLETEVLVKISLVLRCQPGDLIELTDK